MVIKIDVEGAKPAVLQGGRSLLSETRPVLIFEHLARAAELYGATPEALWNLLTESGYVSFAVTGEGPFARSAFARATGIVNWLATAAIPTSADKRRD